MGFRRVDELFEGRDGGLRDGLNRRYTRQFLVVTDDKRVGPLEVIFAPGIPRLYESYVSFDTHEVDFFAICRDITPIQDPIDWTLWRVTCTYDSESSSEFGGNAGQPGIIGQPGSGGGTGASGDPTLEPPAIDWSSEIREIAFQLEVGPQPRPILNSAMQPFDPPPTRETSFLILRYSRNEATFDPIAKNEYSLATNELPFLGFERRQVLCRPITASQRYIGPFKYWRVNYEFWINENLWYLSLLDQGLCELGADGTPVHILDDHGSPISQPVLLLDGVKMTQDQINAPAPLGPQFFNFQRYKEIDLNPLNIVL